MKNSRSYLAIALAFVLALTSQSMAVARGMATADGEIVLCTGSGPVTVLVDAEGNPTGPAHICPDRALSLFAALEAGFEPPVFPGAVKRIARPLEARALVAWEHVTASARAPPSFI